MPFSRVNMWLVALAAILGSPAVAAAQTTEYGTLTMTLQLQDEDGDWRDMSDDERTTFFNQANCECDTMVRIELDLTEDGETPLPDNDLQLWAGVNCARDGEIEEIEDDCRKISGNNVPARSLEDAVVTVDVPASDIMFISGECEATPAKDMTIYAFIDPDGTRTDLDPWILKPDEGVHVDTKPPPAHTEIKAKGGEDRIVVTWKIPDTAGGDIEGYQVLCARADTNAPLFPEPTEVARYETQANTCPDEAATGAGGGSAFGVVPHGAGDASGDATGDATPDAADAGDADDGDAEPDTGTTDPTVLGSMEERFICGSAGAGSPQAEVDVPVEITGDIIIRVVAYDENGNPLLMTPTPSEARLEPVTDFWEHYGNSGGGAKGGFCSVSAGGRTQLALVLGILFLAVVPIVALVWRRRGRGGAGTGSLLVLVAAGALLGSVPTADAQLIIDDEPEGPPTSNWSFEFKLGPYLPDVDGEPGLMGKPYDQMFGGSRLMYVMELDRYFLWPAGSLGVAGTLGYFRDKDGAFTQEENGSTDVEERSEADSTSITLVPTSLSLVYRLGVIADNTAVPLVPYARVGLSYYLWWIRKGNGDVASLPDNGKARGGSLGWQATVGLAFRIDALDPEASDNMAADWGVEHTSIFAEVLYADVDGFGDSERLRVGDTTWLAGLGFDF